MKKLALNKKTIANLDSPEKIVGGVASIIFLSCEKSSETKTGKLTWRGKDLFYNIQGDYFSWADCTLIMDAAGNMFQVDNGSGGGVTYTRIQ